MQILNFKLKQINNVFNIFFFFLTLLENISIEKKVKVDGKVRDGNKGKKIKEKQESR